jgi:hypothetical protein
MKTKSFIVFLCLVATVYSFAQNESSMLDSYLKNFDKGSNTVKLELIEEAALLDKISLGPLFHRAIDFAISNSSKLDQDSAIKELALISIRECRDLNYTQAKYSVLRLFETYDDFAMRETILHALATLAKGDTAIAASLNNYLETQNNIYKTSKMPNKKLVTICIQTLAALDDASSFTPVFNTMILNYDEAISMLSYNTLLNLSGDFRSSILNILKIGTTFEKKRALEISLQHKKMEDTKKGEIAENALDIALHYSTPNLQDQKMIREIRDIATEALSGFKWGKASGLIISHFDTTLLEYDRGVAAKSSLLIAIGALGNMGTHAAAERLTLYLNILNAFTENKKPYDSQIILAVIKNLGKLGDKIAFDDLMYTKYLNYTSEIKDAAEEAIKNLKW